MSLNNITHGVLTLDGNEQAFPGPVGQSGGIILKAAIGNANPVFIGKTGVTNSGAATDGIPLQPADPPLKLDLYNPGALKIRGTAGQKLHWMSLTA